MTQESLNVKIVGIGGAGCNLADYLFNNFSHSHCTPQFHLIDTDIAALSTKTCPNKLNIGHSLTRGLGTGGNASIAQKAAQADCERIEALLDKSDLVFLLTGLGGGTGSGAAPLIASLAKKTEARILAFPLSAFTFEGTTRNSLAKQSLNAIQKNSHATIPLSNDLLLQKLSPCATVVDAFSKATEHLCAFLNSTLDTLFKPGLINIDFADLKSTLPNCGGKTLFAFAQASGENYVAQALSNLDICPFLHTPNTPQSASSLIINITAGRDLSLAQVKEIAQTLSNKFKSKDNVLLGACIDETKENFLSIVTLGVTYPGRSTGAKTAEASTTQDGFHQPTLFSLPMAPKKSKKPQTTLSLTEDFNDRGYFAHTEESIYSGQQLDIPTYLRRGVKISI